MPPVLNSGYEGNYNTGTGEKVYITFVRPDKTVSGRIVSRNDSSVVIKTSRSPIQQVVPLENIARMEFQTPGGIRKVHFSWAYGFRIGGPAADMKRAMKDSEYGGTALSILTLLGPPSLNYPVRRNSGLTMNAGVDIDIMPGWRSGINYSKNTGLEIVGLLEASEIADRNSWEFTMTRVKQVYKIKETSRSEWGLGIGVSINKLSVHTVVPVYRDYPDIPIPNAFYEEDFSKTKPGLVLRYMFDSYLGKFFSLHFALESRLIGKITAGTTGAFRPMKEHHLNFSSIDPTFGVRLHF